LKSVGWGRLAYTRLFLAILFFFVTSMTGRTVKPIFTLYGSKDAVPLKAVPFAGLID
jgi:hypothetical protein